MIITDQKLGHHCTLLVAALQCAVIDCFASSPSPCPFADPNPAGRPADDARARHLSLGLAAVPVQQQVVAITYYRPESSSIRPERSFLGDGDASWQQWLVRESEASC